MKMKGSIYETALTCAATAVIFLSILIVLVGGVAITIEFNSNGHSNFKHTLQVKQPTQARLSGSP